MSRDFSWDSQTFAWPLQPPLTFILLLKTTTRVAAWSSPPSHLQVARSSQLQLCIPSSGTHSPTALPTHTLHALALLSPPLEGHLRLASCTSLPWYFVRSSPQSVKRAGMGGGKPCPSRPRNALRAESQPLGGDLAFHSRPVAGRGVLQPGSGTLGERTSRRPPPSRRRRATCQWPKATTHAPHRRRARSGAGPWRACAATRPRLTGGVGAMGLRASAAE